MTTRPRNSSPLSCRAARAASPLWRRLAGGSAALAVFLMAGAMAAADDVLIPVPSGQPVTYLDTVHNALGAEGLTIRFRFVAPEIAREGGAVPASVAQADMAFLCETYALPRVASTGPQPRQVIISLSDRPVPFGEPVPEATQYFEAYRPDGGTCIWEAF